MSTVSESNETNIKSWPISGGNVLLSLNSKKRLIATVKTNDKVAYVMREWIVGIPKEIQGNPKLLMRYLQDTYIRLVPLKDNGFSIHINPRLRGGIGAAALGGFFSAISSGMSFFTSANYIKLAKTAGSEARATIQVGGLEARATIDKAEDSAKNTLTKMGTEVRTSIDKAQKGAQEVLKTASSEMIKTIGLAGIETRHTSKIMELQIEKALGKASRETQLLLETAGMESSHAILLCGDEARKTCFALSQEMTTNIKTARQETNLILSQGSLEVRNILEKASQDVKSIIHVAGEEFAQKSTLIIHEAIGKAEQAVNSTLQQANLHAAGLIEQMGKEARGIILNLGEQGQLLIKDTGHEIRVIADDVLKKAFAGQEMIIKVAGEEARLTVHCIGQELRSSLYEIPCIAGMIAEQTGRNLVYGLKDGLFGAGELNGIINSLKNLKGAENINIQDLLKYVYDQNQLGPQKKSELYKTLIELFNSPVIKERKNLLLFIGLAALDDEGLIQPAGYIKYEQDYRQKVIEKIPGEAGGLLKKHGVEALNFLLPRAVETNITPYEPLNPFEIESEKLKLKTKTIGYVLIDLKSENQYLLTLSEEEKKRAESKELELTQKTIKEASQEKLILDLTDKMKALKTLVDKQKMEIAFLQPSFDTDNIRAGI